MVFNGGVVGDGNDGRKTLGTEATALGLRRGRLIRRRSESREVLWDTHDGMVNDSRERRWEGWK